MCFTGGFLEVVILFVCFKEVTLLSKALLSYAKMMYSDLQARVSV